MTNESGTKSLSKRGSNRKRAGDASGERRHPDHQLDSQVPAAFHAAFPGNQDGVAKKVKVLGVGGTGQVSGGLRAC